MGVIYKEFTDNNVDKIQNATESLSNRMDKTEMDIANLDIRIDEEIDSVEKRIQTQLNSLREAKDDLNSRLYRVERRIWTLAFMIVFYVLIILIHIFS